MTLPNHSISPPRSYTTLYWCRPRPLVHTRSGSRPTGRRARWWRIRGGGRQSPCLCVYLRVNCRFRLNCFSVKRYTWMSTLISGIHMSRFALRLSRKRLHLGPMKRLSSPTRDVIISFLSRTETIHLARAGATRILHGVVCGEKNLFRDERNEHEALPRGPGPVATCSESR